MVKGFSYVRWILPGCFLLLCCLTECRKREEKPVEILSQDEMVQALMKIYINEEKVVRLALPPESSKVVYYALQERLFKDIGTPDSVFKKSLNYYMEKPIELEKIYGALIDSLQLREQRAPSQSQ